MKVTIQASIVISSAEQKLVMRIFSQLCISPLDVMTFEDKNEVLCFMFLPLQVPVLCITHMGQHWA